MSTRLLTPAKQVELDEPGSTNAEAKIRRGISLLADFTRKALPAEERSTAALAFIDVLDDDDCASMLAADLRAAFVSAVLDLGYPFALHLKPEDLAPVRSPRRARKPLLLGVALIALGVGLFATRATERPAAAAPSLPVAPVVSWPASQAVTSLAPNAKPVNVNPVREATFEPMVLSRPQVLRLSDGIPWPPPVRMSRPTVRQSVIAELDSLATRRLWFDVIRAGDQCRSADPLRLDCLAHVAAAHAHLSQRPSSPLFGSHWKRLAALDRLEHEQAARALYRRYLSIAPPDDPHAAKIVRALRADGDWVEPADKAARLELRVLHQTWNCNGDLECLNLGAATWAQRAARTHDPDDLAQADRFKAAADEARSRLTFRTEPL
ncbi:MAG: hypothetical protein ABTQ32_11055 [Myxococcaceae bacterium]